MCRLVFSVIIVAISLNFTIFIPAFAANRILYENFDDKKIDNRIVVYGFSWEKLSPPQYNLNATGRNGTGYCFSSGTVPTANLSMDIVPNPWPSNELYVSFWMRYPKFKSTDGNENFKIFYPHWNGAKSYVHYSMTDRDGVYYSAHGSRGQTLTDGNWLTCPNQADGKWHHYEFYIKFSTGVSRFWYDGVLKVDDKYGSGVWTPAIYYIWAPSIDAEEDGVFSRQVDDWEVWDGMPNGQPSDDNPSPPAAPTRLRVIE